MKLLSSFVRTRLSAAAAISLSSPVLRCCFRALLHFVRSAARPSQDIVSMSTAFEGEGGRLFSSPMPVHHIGCISECDHHPYGGLDPTIAICVVKAECTYWEDQHETGHQRWLLCSARICPGYGGCFSGGMC